MGQGQIRVVQASPPGSGSTFVANLLAGLICPGDPIVFPTSSNIHTAVLSKTHAKEPLRILSDHPEYDIYIVVTSRPPRRLYGRDVLDHPRVLEIRYDDILETPDRDLAATISPLVNRLLHFLPDKALPGLPATALKARALQRLEAMNRVVESLADQPFSVCDPFFHIHGSHRDRTRKRKAAKKGREA